MNLFKADLHIHTVLSPCGDLEMSPSLIVNTAAIRGIDILGVTDHNSTKHGRLISKLAEEKGIFTLCGAEVTTREEVHCLAYFQNFDALDDFQQYLDKHLTPVKNDPKIFGYQVVVDENEQILEFEERLLISSLDQGIDQVATKVYSLGGIFIPAHINRGKFSLLSQLGFIPPELKVDAFEITKATSPEQMRNKFPYVAKSSFITSSDAHWPDAIGSSFSMFRMENRSFTEIFRALHNIDQRRVFPANFATA